MRQYFLFAMILIVSCSREDINIPIEPSDEGFISSVDLSSLPQIESTNAVFYNLSGQEENVLTTLKNSGVNTVRLRIWNNPTNNHSTF